MATFSGLVQLAGVGSSLASSLASSFTYHGLRPCTCNMPHCTS